MCLKERTPPLSTLHLDATLRKMNIDKLGTCENIEDLTHFLTLPFCKVCLLNSLKIAFVGVEKVGALYMLMHMGVG